MGQSKQQQYGDEAVNFLKRDYYVDDGLTSVELISKSQEMCASDNLHLHKFASNKKEVLEALLPEDHAKDLKDLDLRRDSMPAEQSQLSNGAI